MSDESTTTAPTIDFDAELAKPRLLAFLFAEWAETLSSGKAVIAGIFDHIFFLPDNPSIFYVYVRATQILGGPTEITIIAPDGSKFGEMVMEKPENAVFADMKLAYMHGVTRVALPVKQEGMYWFEVVYEGMRLGIVPLEIKRLPENSELHV